MAESAPGRPARWTTAALAAPVVAGVFAGATMWATRVDPLHPSGSSAGAQPASQPLAAASTDPAVLALQHQLAVQQAKVDRLAKKVATVRSQAAALARKNAGGQAPGRQSTGYTSSGSSRSTSSGGSSSGSAAASHSSTPAAPPPPPATHGSTGSSGTG